MRWVKVVGLAVLVAIGTGAVGATLAGARRSAGVLERLNDITRKLAREFDAVLADSWDHPLNDRENLLSEDKIHFATTGQAVLATLVLEQLAARAE